MIPNAPASPETGQFTDVVNLKRSLLDAKLLTAEQLKAVERNVADDGVSLVVALIRSGHVPADRLMALIGEQLHLPYVNLSHYTIERTVLDLISEKIARKFHVLPLFRIENVLTVAMSDFRHIIAIDDVAKGMRANLTVEVVLASEEGITSAIDRWYGLGEARSMLIDELANEVTAAPALEEPEYKGRVGDIRLARAAEEAPIVKIVNSYIAQAMLEDASDIHWESKRDHMLLRFRIDGCLYSRGRLPRAVASAIISRIKILSGMDISQRRLPQDGRVGVVIRNRCIDIRASTIPSMYGENVVMRVLDKSKGVPVLSELGLSSEDAGKFAKMLKLANGIILAAGPTGSGKTTTMCAAIATMNTADRNVMTIEDPIEYEIPGVVQSQVDAKSGATFASMLRAMLRQDPDVIYVGEIRDVETAEVAIRAALTGHLVLSTLHTKDAVGTIERLRDIGIGGALIGEVLGFAFSQRLVRKLCVECRGAGCSACGNVGYKGRTGIFEIMEVTPEIGAMIAADAPRERILEAARRGGMRSLHEAGVRKVEEKITALGEIERMLSVDSLVE